MNGGYPKSARVGGGLNHFQRRRRRKGNEEDRDLPNVIYPASNLHGGERWEPVGCAQIADGDPVEKALRTLREDGLVDLPRGVYRVRCLPDGAWQVGELRSNDEFVLDEDELGSFSPTR